jgi:16S rRNA (guanine527-N7)-methyltransferase
VSGVASRLERELALGLEQMDLPLADDVQAKLLAYLDMLHRWNRTYNLTAVRDPRDMLVQHLFDSLAVLPILAKSALVGRRFAVADVGSGAGLPGIPWALAQADWDVSLIETVAKKSAFQRQVKIELGLANLTVLGQRVETVAAGGFDLVVSRAFASLGDFVALAGHLISASGCLCAMKGVRPDDEIKALPQGWRVEHEQILCVPGLDAQRQILILRKG